MNGRPCSETAGWALCCRRGCHGPFLNLDVYRAAPGWEGYGDCAMCGSTCWVGSAATTGSLHPAADAAVPRDPLIQVLIETNRLQVLAFVQRRNAPTTALPTPLTLATWMRIDVPACTDLVAELLHDGLLEAPPSELAGPTLPLALSDLGRGYLAWAETRAARLPYAASPRMSS